MTTSTTPDFNLIAPVYDQLAQLVFGQSQVQAQGHFLHRIPVGARVLIMGGGSGRILEQVFQQSRPGNLLYLEASEAMLRKAQQRADRLSRSCPVVFRLGTEASLLPTEQFDVVLTPFLLDLYPDPTLSSLVDTVDKALLPGGLWLQTDFHLSTGTWKHLWQKPLLWAMYRFFGALSKVPARQLPHFSEHFQRIRYNELEAAYFFQGFIKASMYQKQVQRV